MIKKLVKKVFRNFIFPVIYYLKLYKLFSFKTAHKCLILNYHGVIEHENFTYNGRHFAKDIFEKHLIYLKNNFDVVTLSEIFEMYRQNHVPSRKTIAITFDDGFENNYSVAFPLLKKYNLPATFFVSAVCVDTKHAILWPEVINILSHFKTELVVDKMVFVKHGRSNFLNVEKNLFISDYIKNSSAFDRDDIMQQIVNSCNLVQILDKVEPDIWKLLERDQIKEMAASGIIEIGSHGYNHFNLGNITHEEAYQDIRKSTELLEEITQQKILSIAFPDSSYNDHVKRICINLGYKQLCAVSYQTQGDDNDKNLLPRHGMSATTNYYSNIIFIHKAFKNLGF